MKSGILKETLRNIYRKAVTFDYPKSMDINIPENHRGHHYVDFRKCIGCSLCAIDCPSNAIQMEKKELKMKNNPKSIYPVIDYYKCIFCYHCVYICPTKAYVTSNKFEMCDLESFSSLTFSMRLLESG